MGTRQSLPRIWLVTDERQDDRLLPAVERLPAGAGILFRHYSLCADARRILFEEVRQRSAGCMLLLAGPPDLAEEWGADGWHGRGSGPGFHSASVHNLAEIREAEEGGAGLLFLGPVFTTRSHPGAKVLGEAGFWQLAAAARRPVIALGGIRQDQAALLASLGAYGWGAVDAWTEAAA
jgi:thiamine-phosphate pyrophosphorylase